MRSMRWIKVELGPSNGPMKTITFLTILFASTQALASVLPIKNSFNVTENVLRGAQPLGKAEALKEAGVQQVLIFKNDTKGEVEKEKEEVVNLADEPSDVMFFK